MRKLPWNPKKNKESIPTLFTKIYSPLPINIGASIAAQKHVKNAKPVQVKYPEKRVVIIPNNSAELM